MKEERSLVSIGNGAMVKRKLDKAFKPMHCTIADVKRYYRNLCETAGSAAKRRVEKRLADS